MISFPPSKINLGLHVVSKRDDGFHNIETCFYPIGLTDILEIIPSQEFAFTQSGLSITGNVEENLCLKTYRLLQTDFRIGNVKIHLHKNIPMGAGLGGGSSDAATTLVLLNEIFKLNLSSKDLQTYAAQLGSDCAFFMDSKPKLGEGRGEIVSIINLSLKDYFLILIKPEVHISTADAYREIELTSPQVNIQQILKQPLHRWKEFLVNDFEKNIFKKYPVIHSIKQKLYSLGAVYASMSGSGASVYGIFEKPVDLKKEFPDTFFYWCGVLK